MANIHYRHYLADLGLSTVPGKLLMVLENKQNRF